MHNELFLGNLSAYSSSPILWSRVSGGMWNRFFITTICFFFPLNIGHNILYGVMENNECGALRFYLFTVIRAVCNKIRKTYAQGFGLMVRASHGGMWCIRRTSPVRTLPQTMYLRSLFFVLYIALSRELE